MKAALKWVGGVLFFCIIGVFVAALFVTKFIDLNDHRQALSELLSKQADAKINIQGEISWQTFPTLSIQLSDIEIKDNKQRYEANVAQSNLQVVWLPLLQKRVEITTMHLNNAEVKVNLDRLTTAAYIDKNKALTPTVMLTSATQASQQKNSDAPQANTRLNIKKLSIENSRVIVIENNKETLKLIDFNLNSKEVGAHQDIFTVTTQTLIQHPRLKNNQAKLDSQILIEPKRHQAEFKDCRIQVKSLSTPCNGTLAWPNQALKAQFNLDVKTNNLNDIFPDSKRKKLILTGDMAYENDVIEIPNLQCQIDDISMNGHARYNLKTKKMHLKPVGIQHFGILHQGQVDVTLAKTPQWNLNTKAGGITVARVMENFKKPSPLTGTGHYNANLSGAGEDKAVIIQTLKGPLNAKVGSGRIYGVDISSMLQQTALKLEKMLELTKQQSPEGMLLGFVTKSVGDIAPTVGSKRYSPFNTLIIQGNFSSGFYHIQKMTLTGADYQIIGSGKINLGQETINAQAKTIWYGQSQDPTVNDLMKKGFDIHISGPLKNPKVTPNTEAFMNAAMAVMQQRFIKKVTERVIDEAIKRGLGREGGSLQPEDVVKDLFGVGGGEKNQAPPPNPIDRFFR